MAIASPRNTHTAVQGGDNNLGVTLAPYEPHVQCDEGSIGPPHNSCGAIASLMFATKAITSFGKAGSGARNIVPGMDTCEALRAVITLPFR